MGEHLIFVYGTLKRNEPNHQNFMQNPALGSNRFIGVGELVGLLPLVVASRHNVPYLLDRPGLGHHVQGEVYQVDDDMLAHLDELEDAPRYYKRKLEPVRIIGEQSSDLAEVGDIVECWCYKLDNFKEDLLQGNQLLVSYSSKLFPYSEPLDIQRRSMEYYKDVMQ